MEQYDTALSEFESDEIAHASSLAELRKLVKSSGAHGFLQYFEPTPKWKSKEKVKEVRAWVVHSQPILRVSEDLLHRRHPLPVKSAPESLVCVSCMQCESSV